MRDEVDHAEPIARPVLDEVCQLLGYDSAEVISVYVEAFSITVVTAARPPAEPQQVMHKHAVL